MQAPHPQSPTLSSVQVLWKQQLRRLAAQRLHPVSGGRGPPSARQLLQNSGGTLWPKGPPLQHLQSGGEHPGSNWGIQRAQPAIQGTPNRQAQADRWGEVESTYSLARRQQCRNFIGPHKTLGTSSCYWKILRHHGMSSPLASRPAPGHPRTLWATERLYQAL